LINEKFEASVNLVVAQKKERRDDYITWTRIAKPCFFLYLGFPRNFYIRSVGNLTSYCEIYMGPGSLFAVGEEVAKTMMYAMPKSEELSEDGILLMFFVKSP
jgi:hypothetical protein